MAHPRLVCLVHHSFRRTSNRHNSKSARRKTATPLVKALFSLVLCLGVGQPVWAQAVSTHVHATPSQIDGAEHPELIPDTVGYRLFFQVVAESRDADPESKARQESHLKQAGLSKQDIPVAANILADFKAEFDRIVAAYNRTAEESMARGEQPDYPSFKKELDTLVVNTHLRLSAGLSVPAMTNFEAHVRQEKKRMKIDAQEAQQ